MVEAQPLPQRYLPAGIRARLLDNINGLQMHILEAGEAKCPCLLLLHGFPELAYSWRKVMPALAAAGFYVVAPDLRGYGRSVGWPDGYDVDIRPFGLMNHARDMVALLAALGRQSVQAVIGHDFGSPVAACCALIRPDLFNRLIMMSAPFEGPPSWPARDGQVNVTNVDDIHQQLAVLSPPRKHYQWYYSTTSANGDMLHCRQGLKAFLRAYYHVKSADWAENKPYPLSAWDADCLAQLPTYYVMKQHQTMAETVAAHMPSATQIANCQWLSEAELDIYAAEFQRTGFQGGLNAYRCLTGAEQADALRLFAGLQIRVPTTFIAGAQDWGIYQKPGALQRMQNQACTDFRETLLLPGAGHWVQQEQPEAVVAAIMNFL